MIVAISTCSKDEIGKENSQRHREEKEQVDECDTRCTRTQFCDVSNVTVDADL